MKTAIFISWKQWGISKIQKHRETMRIVIRNSDKIEVRILLPQTCQECLRGNIRKSASCDQQTRLCAESIMWSRPATHTFGINKLPEKFLAAQLVVNALFLDHNHRTDIRIYSYNKIFICTGDPFVANRQSSVIAVWKSMMIIITAVKGKFNFSCNQSWTHNAAMKISVAFLDTLH